MSNASQKPKKADIPSTLNSSKKSFLLRRFCWYDIVVMDFTFNLFIIFNKERGHCAEGRRWGGGTGRKEERVF
jgi:hypothetical protein